MPKYTALNDRRWYWIARKGRTACCDCGLVHDEEYKLAPTFNGGKKIMFRTIRNRRATAQIRRSMGIRLDMKLTRKSGKR